MHIDILEERARGDRIITGIAQAMGTEGIDLIDLNQVRADYDEYLNSPPDQPVDVEKLELMRALGITGKNR